MCTSISFATKPYTMRLRKNSIFKASMLTWLTGIMLVWSSANIKYFAALSSRCCFEFLTYVGGVAN